MGATAAALAVVTGLGVEAVVGRRLGALLLPRSQERLFAPGLVLASCRILSSKFRVFFLKRAVFLLNRGTTGNSMRFCFSTLTAYIEINIGCSIRGCNPFSLCFPALDLQSISGNRSRVGWRVRPDSYR